jgi:hypothetical protein
MREPGAPEGGKTTPRQSSREPKGAPVPGLRSERAELVSDEGRHRAKAPGGEWWEGMGGVKRAHQCGPFDSYVAKAPLR